MKCDICSKKVETTFLNKIVGTVIYDKKHKKKTICANCQRTLKTKDDILEKL